MFFLNLILFAYCPKCYLSLGFKCSVGFCWARLVLALKSGNQCCSGEIGFGDNIALGFCWFSETRLVLIIQNIHELFCWFSEISLV